MYWKEEHEKEELVCGEFLKKKFRKSISISHELPVKSGPRGVTTSKITNIISSIGPLMPRERMKFWEELPCNKSSNDLTINYEHLNRTEKCASQSRRTSDGGKNI